MKRTNMKIDEIDIDHEYAPPQDEVFIEKYKRYSEGTLPMYLILVPSDYVKPFSLEYYPEDWTPFLPFIKSLVEKINVEDFEDFPFPWVYQKGRFLVISDDYPAYYAFLESKKGSMFCQCFGKPNHPEVKIIKGPFFKEQHRND